MWKSGSIFACSIIIIIVSWFYNSHQKELVAFDHAKKYVSQQYHQDGPLINGGIRYDRGRGNFAVIVENESTNKKYYLEVKIRKDSSLVSIIDETFTIEVPHTPK